MEVTPGRYQVLQTEDDDTRMGESGTVWRPQDGPPPPYSSVLPAEGQVGAFPPAKPPAYNVAASLPSYEEAEKAKGSNPVPTTVIPAPDCDEDFPGREEGEDGEQLRIGSDGIFMVSFFMAFLFNWVGFFLSFCLTNTIAGRYGAISGFGLSLVKWIIIVRFSDYFTGYFDGQYWLWWIFLMLGLLLFLRGFLNYLKVRKVSDLSSISRTRLLFIY
uniref:Nedd4 family interacting protein 1 n=1 Tax=Eptatretus burgeri TaxID=7764 RepID=A0A8C4QWR6_EPTBU